MRLAWALTLPWVFGMLGCQQVGADTEQSVLSAPVVSAPSVALPSMALPSVAAGLKSADVVKKVGEDSGYAASGCRLTQVKGQVLGNDGKPLRRGVVLDGQRWLSLSEGSRLTVKHQRGGRELSVMGPAKVLPCAGGEEILILANGALQAHAGVGSRPGAEALLSTPFGTLRYADARVGLQVSAVKMKLELKSGDAFWVAEGESSRVVPGQILSLSHAEPRSVKQAIAGCSELSQQVEQAARAVLQTVGKGLGKRAVTHVRLQRRAAAACAKAMAVALSRLSGVQLNTAWHQLETARRLFRSVPAIKK